MSISMHAFDTLAFAKKLKSAGYTDAQAEALVEAQGEVFREMLASTLATKDDVRDMATKDDIRDLAAKMATKDDIRDMATKADIRDMATKDDIKRLEGDIKRLEGEIVGLDTKIELMGQRLTIRLGGMLVAAVGVLAAMRFFS